MIQIFPLWSIPILSVGVLLAALEVGRILGRTLSSKDLKFSETTTHAYLGAILSLVAFLLAFTFNMTAERFDDRRAVLIDDVNAIGTTYLRANMIAEPERSAVRSLLREYVDSRLAESLSTEQKAARADELHVQLWQQATAAAEKDKSPITGLFVDSLNRLIDTGSKRVAIVSLHSIPGLVWIALILLTIVALSSMGCLAGMFDRGRSPFAIVIAVAFSIVIYLIADLDRPGQGFVLPSEEGMHALQITMVRGG